MEPLTRVTEPTLDVLDVLLQTGDPVWGLLLAKTTQRPAGTIYPILERLERLGWVSGQWEHEDARSGPRRRLYTLTAGGASEARRLLAARRARAPQARPAAQGGLA